MEQTDFSYVTFVGSDKRRDLVEFFSDLNISIHNIKVLHVKEDSILGNHYSTSANEYFYLAKGEAEVTIIDVKTKEKITFDMFRMSPIKIPPYFAHSFKMKKDSILIEAMTKIYDKKKEIPFDTGQV